MPGLNQDSSCGSASMAATTSRPSLMIWMSLASAKAATRPSAQYIRSRLASPYLTMSLSATQVAGPCTPPASLHTGEQVRQEVALTCQAWANASLSTVAAASLWPRWMDGLRANAYTTLCTASWPIVRWKPGDCLSARPTRSAPECGAPITKTGWRTLRPFTTRMCGRGGMTTHQSDTGHGAEDHDPDS